MRSDDAPQEVQPKSNKLLIIILAFVVLLGAGGAVAYMKFGGATPANASVEKEKTPVSYTLPTFLVNLADPGSKRFLKVTIDLQLDSKAAAEQCKTLDPEIKDSILTILSSQEAGDIVSADDKRRLKKLLKQTLNHLITNGKVLQVYFTDFLIQ
ncbi:MAG: flagellar basal body-associated FliL family protein [Syntrophobacteraceae bacterium]